MEDIDRHEAEVFSRIEGTEDVAETESRFSVEETSDAFEPGQDFAVWDHGREDYYIKEDGTIPTFETKEEAEHYLQSMEPDTSGHDVQKSVEEPAIEKPVKQPAPKIDKSNAVNFHITDDALGAGSAKEKFRRNIEAIRTLERWRARTVSPHGRNSRFYHSMLAGAGLPMPLMKANLHGRENISS